MLLDDYRKADAAKLITTLPINGTFMGDYFSVIMFYTSILRTLKLVLVSPIYTVSPGVSIQD